MDDDLIFQISRLVSGTGYAYYKGYVIEWRCNQLLVYPSSGVSQSSIIEHPRNIEAAIKYIDGLVP